MGLSMGGLLAPHAAAFEHRLAAVIAVDGAYDQGQTVRAGAGDVPGLERRLRAGADPELDAQLARQMQASPVMRWAMEQAQWAFGVPTPRQACAAFLDYHLRDGIAEKIACPALICDAASGLFFAGQARQLFDHCGRIGLVRPDRPCPRSRGAHIRGHVLGGLPGGQVGNRHVGARTGQGPCDGRPDAP